VDRRGSGRREVPRWVAERSIPGRRLFIAVPLPVSVRRDVEAIVERVRARVRERWAIDGRGELRDVRWVRLDGLHLTLRFLGPTLDDRLPAIEAAMREAASGFPAVEAAVAGAGAFPGPGRPRVLWIGVARGADGLARLAGRLEDRLSAAGWPREDRPFKAHLTLARCDGIPAGAMTGEELVDAARTLDDPWVADRLVLFESHTGGGPARYESLFELPLEG
jgi:2'-5' RNA ligase